MDVAQVKCCNFFTLDHRFFLKEKDGSFVLKIFSIFNKLIFRGFFQGKPGYSLSALKSYIPSQYFPLAPTKESCKKEIEDLKQEIAEEGGEAWNLVRDGEEKNSDPRVTVILYLDIALEHIKGAHIDQAIDALKQIAYDDSKIGTVLINLHVLVSKQEECLSFINQLIVKKPSWAKGLYRDVLRHMPNYWMFYTELAVLVQDPIEKAHIFVRGALASIENDSHTNAHTFLDEAKKVCRSPKLDQS